MSDYLIELGEAMERHMPEGDMFYWMEQIMYNKKILKKAERFLRHDKKSLRRVV